MREQSFRVKKQLMRAGGYSESNNYNTALVIVSQFGDGASLRGSAILSKGAEYEQGE